jgi:hypothetical protein
MEPYPSNNGTKLGLVVHIYVCHRRRIVNSELFSSVQSHNGDIAKIPHFQQSHKTLGSTYLMCGLTHSIMITFVTTISLSDGILPRTSPLIVGELCF